MQTFNLPPCKIVGDIKEQIKEAILDGKIHNNHHEAQQFMMSIAKEMGVEI